MHRDATCRNVQERVGCMRRAAKVRNAVSKHATCFDAGYAKQWMILDMSSL